CVLPLRLAGQAIRPACQLAEPAHIGLGILPTHAGGWMPVVLRIARPVPCRSAVEPVFATVPDEACVSGMSRRFRKMAELATGKLETTDGERGYAHPPLRHAAVTKGIVQTLARLFVRAGAHQEFSGRN